MPEEYFFEDFRAEWKRSDKVTFKNYQIAFKEIDTNPALSTTEAKLDVLKQVTMKTTCMNLLNEEDPVIDKLALYTLAHRNYLHSLSYHIMKNYKVNWGLKNILKI